MSVVRYWATKNKKLHGGSRGKGPGTQSCVLAILGDSNCTTDFGALHPNRLAALVWPLKHGYKQAPGACLEVAVLLRVHITFAADLP